MLLAECCQLVARWSNVVDVTKPVGGCLQLFVLVATGSVRGYGLEPDLDWVCICVRDCACALDWACARDWACAARDWVWDCA